MTQTSPIDRPLPVGGSSTATVAALVTAATAAAAKLPTAEPLSAGQPVLDPSVAVQPDDAGSAVIAALAGGATGEIAVIVARDLVDALQESPLGRLDVVAAVQPALEAAAAALGGSRAQAGREVPVDLVQDGMDGKGTYVAVPLLDGTGRQRATVVAGVTLVNTGAAGAGSPGTGATASRGLDLLRDVEMEVTAELGRTRMTVRDLLSLAPGAVVELDRTAGSPCDLYVNGTLMARGEVVVVDEDFGIRVTEIADPSQDGEHR